MLGELKDHKNSYEEIIFKSEFELNNLNNELKIIDRQIEMIDNFSHPHKKALEAVIKEQLKNKKKNTKEKIEEHENKKKNAQNNIDATSVLEGIINNFDER